MGGRCCKERQQHTCSLARRFQSRWSTGGFVEAQGEVERKMDWEQKSLGRKRFSMVEKQAAPPPHVTGSDPRATTSLRPTVDMSALATVLNPNRAPGSASLTRSCRPGRPPLVCGNCVKAVSTELRLRKMSALGSTHLMRMGMTLMSATLSP